MTDRRSGVCVAVGTGIADFNMQVQAAHRAATSMLRQQVARLPLYPFMLAERRGKPLTEGMAKVMGKCLGVPIDIKDDREVVFCDGLEFPFQWKKGDGYFLVHIKDGQICAGWVNGDHDLNIEFRGTDPDKMTKEIVRRDFLSPSHTAYIAGELLLAHHCLVNELEYVQR